MATGQGAVLLSISYYRNVGKRCVPYSSAASEVRLVASFYILEHLYSTENVFFLYYTTDPLNVKVNKLEGNN